MQSLNKAAVEAGILPDKSGQQEHGSSFFNVNDHEFMENLLIKEIGFKSQRYWYSPYIVTFENEVSYIKQQASFGLMGKDFDYDKAS